MARYDAVLFDLLTALVDSWTLWNRVAGGEAPGRAWRAAYLRNTYAAGAYRPYEQMVADAAEEVGLSPALAGELARRYGELDPWPEAGEVLTTLRRDGRRLAVVTNCSEALAARAVAATGAHFDVVVSAERAGFYKPRPEPYRMALRELGVAPEHALFVAGSAYDLPGAAGVGLATFWHDRIGMTPPEGAPVPLAHESSLAPLVSHVFGNR